MAGTFLKSMITHAHLSKFKSGTALDPYVIEANSELLDLASDLDVDHDNIADPLPLKAVRYLDNYVTMRFAEDSIGTNNVQVGENDMYRRMFLQAEASLSKNKMRVSKAILDGTISDEEPVDRSTRTIRRVRVS